MNKRKRKALDGSIEKWEGIVEGTRLDYGSSNCSLCKLYRKKIRSCKSCPVYYETEESECTGSPWEDWLDHHTWDHDDDFPLKIECPECKELAQKELDFLKSLLPKSAK